MSWYSITIQDNLDFHFLASQIILKIPFASSSVKIHTIKKHVKKIFKIPLFHCCFTFFERLCPAALLMQVRVDYLAFTYLSWPEGSVRIGGKHFPKDRAKRWQRGGEAIFSPTRLNCFFERYFLFSVFRLIPIFLFLLLNCSDLNQLTVEYYILAVADSLCPVLWRSHASYMPNNLIYCFCILLSLYLLVCFDL